MPTTESRVHFDPDLIRRYDIPGPRYTSYPTADRFTAFDQAAYKRSLPTRTVGNGLTNEWSLYVHLPFCRNICFYCACNKVITRDQSKSATYMDYLLQELDLRSADLQGRPPLHQLHLGGGTPTFSTDSELATLIDAIASSFTVSDTTEMSIEVDPRTVDATRLATLRSLGFNRISLGVQDFDSGVQLAVNRIQPYEQVRALMESARALDFDSVNFDLIYGLPRQSRATFEKTLDQVIGLSPDRIALYSYAHLPQRFKPQRRISALTIPAADEKLAIMGLAMARMGDAGYVHIGMDHFAREDDELAQAQQRGHLHRNFQGYSTQADLDLMGLGVSAISKIGTTYSQNARELPAYYDAIEQGKLPVERGLALSDDDVIRRDVIMSLMCHFTLSKDDIERTYGIDFDDYFAGEIADLEAFCDSDLIHVNDDSIDVTVKGRLLVRPIAMVFDRYLRDQQDRTRFSRVI